MKCKRTLYTGVAVTALVALLSSNTVFAQSTLTDDQAFVQELFPQLSQSEAVSREDLNRFNSILLRAYQNQQLSTDTDAWLGDISADRASSIVGRYRLTDLQQALSRLSPDSAATPIDQPMPITSQATEPSPSQNAASPVSDASDSGRAPSQMENDVFVRYMMEQMEQRQTLAREDLIRLEALVSSGRAQKEIASTGRENMASLVALYGLNDLASTLRQAPASPASNSAADRLARITSAPQNDADYRDEYMAQINQHDVSGVGRFRGATLTVYSELLEPFTLDDPIAGEQIQATVTSCLRAGSTPTEQAPNLTQHLQVLELPKSVTVERFVESKNMGRGEVIDIYDHYSVTQVSVDWSLASEKRVPAFFYGYKIGTKSTNSRLERTSLTSRDAQWHGFGCNPRSIRTNR